MFIRTKVTGSAGVNDVPVSRLTVRSPRRKDRLPLVLGVWASPWSRRIRGRMAAAHASRHAAGDVRRASSAIAASPRVTRTREHLDHRREASPSRQKARRPRRYRVDPFDEFLVFMLAVDSTRLRVARLPPGRPKGRKPGPDSRARRASPEGVRKKVRPGPARPAPFGREPRGRDPVSTRRSRPWGRGRCATRQAPCPRGRGRPIDSADGRGNAGPRSKRLTPPGPAWRRAGAPAVSPNPKQESVATGYLYFTIRVHSAFTLIFKRSLV